MLSSIKKSLYFKCKAEEENAELMKRINQLERDMNTVQAELAISGEKLEKANKKNADVFNY